MNVDAEVELIDAEREKASTLDAPIDDAIGRSLFGRARGFAKSTISSAAAASKDPLPPMHPIPSHTGLADVATQTCDDMQEHFTCGPSMDIGDLFGAQQVDIVSGTSNSDVKGEVASSRSVSLIGRALGIVGGGASQTQAHVVASPSKRAEEAFLQESVASMQLLDAPPLDEKIGFSHCGTEATPQLSAVNSVALDTMRSEAGSSGGRSIFGIARGLLPSSAPKAEVAEGIVGEVANADCQELRRRLEVDGRMATEGSERSCRSQAGATVSDGTSEFSGTSSQLSSLLARALGGSGGVAVSSVGQPSKLFPTAESSDGHEMHRAQASPMEKTSGAFGLSSCASKADEVVVSSVNESPSLAHSALLLTPPATPMSLDGCTVAVIAPAAATVCDAMPEVPRGQLECPSDASSAGVLSTLLVSSGQDMLPQQEHQQLQQQQQQQQQQQPQQQQQQRQSLFDMARAGLTGRGLAPLKVDASIAGSSSCASFTSSNSVPTFPPTVADVACSDDNSVVSSVQADFTAPLAAVQHAGMVAAVVAAAETSADGVGITSSAHNIAHDSPSLANESPPIVPSEQAVIERASQRMSIFGLTRTLGGARSNTSSPKPKNSSMDRREQLSPVSESPARGREGVAGLPFLPQPAPPECGEFQEGHAHTADLQQGLTVGEDDLQLDCCQPEAARLVSVDSFESAAGYLREEVSRESSCADSLCNAR